MGAEGCNLEVQSLVSDDWILASLEEDLWAQGEPAPWGRDCTRHGIGGSTRVGALDDAFLRHRPLPLLVDSSMALMF